MLFNSGLISPKPYWFMYLDSAGSHASANIMFISCFCIFGFIFFAKFGRHKVVGVVREATWKPCQEVKVSGFEVISRRSLGSSGLEGLVIWSYKREGGF